MSGIAGIVHLDGAPVDRKLLLRMADFLRFRGPDAQRIWVEGPAGLGHTLLKTTRESEREQQPFTLGGKVWIVADARVDARPELIAKLRAGGHEFGPDVPDVELILRAYDIWHEDCVEHLLGDFAFAIWDTARRRLFCARDHLGIKPLYYAHLGSHVIFSNTLDCIRLHPAVSDRLNDLTVTDFLLFDLNQDKATTAYADIQRVPPAHCATWSEAGFRLRGYWTMPVDEPIFYRRRDDYVENFKELLRAAVGDRLRTARVGILMSGGIDSPAIAATAHGLLRDSSGSSGVCAFTTAYDGYDEERKYAGLVAKKLGIPIQFQGWSDDIVDPEWHLTSFHTPEPVPYPASLAAGRAYQRHMASHSRVTFYGEGPDNALDYEWQPYLSYLVRQRRFGRLVQDVCSHAVLHRRIPLLSNLARLVRRRPRPAAEPEFPDWFNPELERRLELRTRWEQHKVEPPSPHPLRPYGYSSLQSPLWPAVFEAFDVASTGALLEVRHPLMDVRLLRYMLAVPAVPWCRAKYLLRRALRGLVPEAVLRRPKSPVRRDPWTERVQQCGLPPLVPAPELELYLDISRAERANGAKRERFWVDFRTRALNFWLHNRRWNGTIGADIRNARMRRI